jgi:hypothetical protein
MREAVSPARFTEKLSLGLTWSGGQEGRVPAFGRGESARVRGPGSTRWRSPSLRAGVSAHAGDDPFRGRHPAKPTYGKGRSCGRCGISESRVSAADVEGRF